MFGTMGFTELILILVIVLIIFGAGKLPQLGEGIGKALKGFRKEVQPNLPPRTTTNDFGGEESVSARQAESAPDVDPEVVKARIAERQQRVMDRQRTSGRSADAPS